MSPVSFKVFRVDAAIDPGRAVNPEAIRQQVEGSIMLSLSTAMREQVLFADGKVLNGTFSTYAPIVMRDSPLEINVTILEDSSAPIGGAGEPGVTPLLAAVGNAIYDAVGARLFAVPFTPERILAALNGDASATPIAG